MITLEELLDDVNIMMTTLRVPYKKVSLGSKFPDVFEIPNLGAIIACIYPDDYSYILHKLQANFKNYRYIFITTSESLFEKKDDIIWDLMRGGYIRYIRLNYQRQFNEIIQQGFGQKIIRERLKIWGNKAKYRYLIKENEDCLKASIPAVLNYDAAFFDFMPEKIMEDDNV
ncbi:hypothetical protein JZU46_06120 [bacterium]|nr:hypothetical protein [bacterium]